jgi:hypothetical protein
MPLQNPGGKRLPKLVAEYLGIKNEKLCSSMQRLKQTNAWDMKRTLRSHAWTRCRLEVICSELSMLHRRYNASLATQENGDGDETLNVTVEFSQVGSHVKLSGRFELTSSYPFGFLNTQVQQTGRQVDLDDLQGLLMKNAKPGFGYLSRTVAVINAFLHNKKAV